MVAIKAILLNLLSVGAAYGMLVATFQWGWGESLLDFESNGGITPWLPMFLFVILFGLSMDYHVFILSRVREAYDRGLSNEEAVAHGIKSTAGVVTSAAVVMVGTFSVFALLPVIDMKEMGIGLAAAVLIDATLIRAVLLPATMKLLGDRNWYLPSWLEWLPRLEHESAPRGHAGAPPSRVAPHTLPPAAPRDQRGAAAHSLSSRLEQHLGTTQRLRTDLRDDVSRPCHSQSVVALGSLAIVGLHVVDDSFFHPEPGTSALDHLAGGLVPARRARARSRRLPPRARRAARDDRSRRRPVRARDRRGLRRLPDGHGRPLRRRLHRPARPSGRARADRSRGRDALAITQARRRRRRRYTRRALITVAAPVLAYATVAPSHSATSSRT